MRLLTPLGTGGLVRSSNVAVVAAKADCLLPVEAAALKAAVAAELADSSGPPPPAAASESSAIFADTPAPSLLKRGERREA